MQIILRDIPVSAGRCRYEKLFRAEAKFDSILYVAHDVVVIFIWCTPDGSAKGADGTK